MLKYICKSSEKSISKGTGLNYPKNKGKWLWLHISAPTEKELEKIRSDFAVSDKILHRFFREQRSIRYSFNPLTFSFVDYYLKSGKVEIEKILYVIGDKYLITVSAVPLAHYEEIYSLIFGKAKKINNVGYLFYEIIDRDVEENFDVLNTTENKIIDLEKGVLTPNDIKNKVTGIIDFKRYLTLMRRRFWRSSKILFSIKKGLTPVELDDNLVRLLDDVHDTYIYQMEMVSSQKETLSDALVIYESVMANNLAHISNTINFGLKRLTTIMFLWTAIATILSIPNTIATIFGIPEWPIHGEMWKGIAALLLVSAIVPLWWFVSYWQKIKKEYLA